MTTLRPILGRGVAQRRLGAKIPEFRQKFPVLLGAPVVPKAQIWNSKKICLGSPPPLKASFSARRKLQVKKKVSQNRTKNCNNKQQQQETTIFSANKNTRTLGAGDYPALLKYFFKTLF